MFPTVDAEDLAQVTLVDSKQIQSRDAPETAELHQVAKQLNCKEKTIMLIKEIVFFAAILLTTYGALQNTYKVSKYPQSVRFFNSTSLVTDWYRGQLTSALTVINRADVSFVMYYAPWDAECQYVRNEFENAAYVLHNRVHFSAINCWSPGSECRLMHNKISSWPILIAYTTTTKGYFYKGPKDAPSMVKFLEMIMKPLEKISSTADLVNLLSVCDLVAVGYTPLTETSKYYNVWYNVALKMREYDTIEEICFGVVTSEDLALSLEVVSLPSARLMLWNDTKDFTVDVSQLEHNWTEPALTEWMLENFTQPVARIIPMWKKAFSFERYVDGNPLLILFTPLNPLYKQIPYYDLLREVAMEYYNCNNNVSSQWITELIKLQQMQRLLYQQKDVMKFCQDYKYKKPFQKLDTTKKSIISHNNKYPWSNATTKNHKYGALNSGAKRDFDITKGRSVDSTLHLMSSLEMLKECSTKMLPAEKSFYDSHCTSIKDNLYCEQNSESYTEDFETSMLPFEDDPLAPENLLHENVNHYCKVMKFAHNWGAPVLLGEVAGSVPHVRGVACTSNVTLTMVAVDSINNHHFAESLGIDILNQKDMTTLVILDTKHQSQFVLSEEYNAKSVRDFIANFTDGRLKRYLRSNIDAASYTHYFGSNGKSERERAENTEEIIDLTTHTFEEVVNTPGVTTLVGVCGGGCGARVAAALCGAVRVLRAGGERAAAARLDARAHDLPWQYTPHALPALLVFPAYSGAGGSRRYPWAQRVSAGGLVALALRALGAPRHLRVRLALCKQRHGQLEKISCLVDLREHVTSVIGRNLKYWRRSEDAELKRAVFRRLNHLHAIALALSFIHADDLTDHSDKVNSLTSSLRLLTHHWDIDGSMLINSTVSRTGS